MHNKYFCVQKYLIGGRNREGGRLSRKKQLIALKIVYCVGEAVDKGDN